MNDAALAQRLLAALLFCIAGFPVLFGAMTLPLAPQLIEHYAKGTHTPGTDSYHRDMQRALVATAGNTVVRAAGIFILLGFAAVAFWPAPMLARCVYVAAVAAAVGHLAMPIVDGGPMMLVIWAHPFYFLPAIAGALSFVGLKLSRQLPSTR